VKKPLHLARVVAALAMFLTFAFLPARAVAAPSNVGVLWLYTGLPGSATVITFPYQDSASSLQDFTFQVTGSTPSTYQWTNLAVRVNGTPIPNPCVPLTGATGGIDCQFANGAVNDGDSITLSSDAIPSIPLSTGGTLFVQDWLNEGTSINVNGPVMTPGAIRAARAAISKAQVAEGSVHYVLVAPGSKIVGDVDGHRGISRLTVSGSGKTGHLIKLLINATIYLRGDAFAWRQLGAPTSFTSRYAGKWVSIHHGSPLYDAFRVTITLATWMLFEMPTSRLFAVGGTFHGKNVWGLCPQGPSQGSCASRGSTIYVPYNARLPVGGVKGLGRHILSRFTLSRWHEAVRVKAPAHAVPIP
jgi:hypothetical protein